MPLSRLLIPRSQMLTPCSPFMSSMLLNLARWLGRDARALPKPPAPAPLSRSERELRMPGLRWLGSLLSKSFDMDASAAPAAALGSPIWSETVASVNVCDGRREPLVMPMTRRGREERELGGKETAQKRMREFQGRERHMGYMSERGVVAAGSPLYGKALAH